MPANLHANLRDLALSYATEIIAAVRSASLRELFEPAASARDPMDRSPRAVASKRRTAGFVERSGKPLQARIGQLRRLAALKPDDSVRYAMGAIVKELKSHPEIYGDSAVSMAAVAIGEDLPGLYRFASVAERWSAGEVRSLLSGGAISWSHLVALARVESRPLRQRFMRQVRREGLTLRELAAVVDQVLASRAMK